MKITALNLRHGGASRIQEIAGWLLESESDVLVCPEFRRNSAGDTLTRILGAHGFNSFSSHTDNPRENGVVVFSKQESERVDLDPPEADIARISACRVEDVVIAGVYFAQMNEKRSLFDFLLSPNNGLGEARLIIGDFNTGAHFKDELGATFYCNQHFEALSETGLTDLWRKLHGDEAREYSWISNRGGPFRIDHAFGSSKVCDRLVRCDYDHSTRPGLTDHSALSVGLANR